MAESEDGASGHDPELDAMAAKPYQPPWAPLPMFRGEAVVTPFLHELLRSPEATNRARAALLLGQIACLDSAEPLAAALKDADRSVRVQAGIALAGMGDARGVPTCAAALRSDAPWVRFYAAYGLWRVGSPAAKAALQAGLPDQGKLVTEAVNGALRTPHAVLPRVQGLPKGAKVSPKPAPQQMWEQAADVLTRESDWWWHKGNYEQAIRCHEACILLEPTYVEDYSVVAWLQWSLGRGEEAIATLERATAAAPQDPEAHFALGEHHFKTKAYAQAEAPLRKAVELGGDHLVQRSYAHCLEKLGKLDEALKQWAAIVQARPTDATAVANYERVKALVAAEGGK